MNETTRSIEAFVEAIERATTVREVENTFLTATAALGFEHAALFSCAQPRAGNAGISFARLPAGWLEYYFDRRFYEIDPVFDRVRRTLTPFSWADPAYRQGLTQAQKDMLAECDDAGLANGLAIPIKDGSSPGCCMLTPGKDNVDPQSYLLGQSLAAFAYACGQRLLGETTGARRKLTVRERECLLLAARGKSDWAIGEVLGLSERTVHHVIERAKNRYGAATRVQAIIEAIAAGEFGASDAIG